MKIMSTNLSFTGLWGKEKIDLISVPYYNEAYLCDMGVSHTVTTKVYHPFKDESDEFIRSIVEANESYSKSKSEAVEYITEENVEVKPRLNITAEEFEKYKNDDLLSKQENNVEDMLKLADLKEYLIRNRLR